MHKEIKRIVEELPVLEDPPGPFVARDDFDALLRRVFVSKFEANLAPSWKAVEGMIVAKAQQYTGDGDEQKVQP